MKTRDEHFSFQERRREQITPFKSVMERESWYAAFPSPTPLSNNGPKMLLLRWEGDILGQVSYLLLGEREGFSQNKMKVFQQPRSSL